MSASDLVFDCQSTHHLLTALLLTETGLFGAPPAHPVNQHRWLVDSFSGIQGRLAAAAWEETGAIRLAPFLDVAVSRQADARLFMTLYTGLNNLASCAVPVSRQLDLVVYPLVGEMVRKTPGLHAILAEAYRAHAAEHGEPVAVRVRRSLTELFGLASVADAGADLARHGNGADAPPPGPR